MNAKLIAIDIAKNVFQVCPFNQNMKVISNKRISRAKFITELCKYEPTTVVMEACYSAHYWGSTISALGFDVKLIPAQHVKPFVRGNKNDQKDAVAIGEASQRPNIKFVPVKTVAQQDVQMYLRVREKYVANRTATVNQIRGFLSEFWVIAAQEWRKLRTSIPLVLEDVENGMSHTYRAIIHQLYQDLIELTEKIDRVEIGMGELLANDSDYKLVLSIPGVGPILGSMIIAAAGRGQAFQNAREFAVWLGLTPKQIASGDKSILTSITKRGNKQLRTLFIHGARAVINWVDKKQDRLSRWIKTIIERRGMQKAIVALAHKLARITWAVLAHQQPYKKDYKIA